LFIILFYTNSGLNFISDKIIVLLSYDFQLNTLKNSIKKHKSPSVY